MSEIPYLNYIAPPVIGAVIGYLTNSIAIKMLFKPYQEWRIMGIKVPFTPGVIPRHREEIARNIGKMVGNILLNEETLKKQLSSSHSQEVLDKVLHKNIDDLLDYDAPALYKMIPNSLQALFNSYYSKIKQSLRKTLFQLFSGDIFRKMIHSIILFKLDEVSQKTIAEVVSRSQLEAFLDLVLKKLMILMNNGDFLTEWLNKQLDQLKKNKHKLGDLVPEEAVLPLLKWIREEMPQLLDQLEGTVFESELDKKLFLTLKNAIFSYMEKLNTVQKFVVNAWGVEDRVNEDLPKVITNGIGQIFDNLRSEEMQDRIINSLLKSINRLLSNDIGDLLGSVGDGDFDNLKSAVQGKVNGYLKDGQLYNSILETIVNNYDKYAHRKVSEFLEKGDLNQESIGGYVSDFIVKAVQNERVFNKIFNLLEEKMDDWVYNKPIGHLDIFLSLETQHKETISGFFSHQILKVLEDDISYVVEAINVRQVGVGKIKLFPVEEVENLVLLVIKKHLKWINIFGAILGAIIGSLRLVF